MNVSKEIWKEILNILNKYNISYTTHYENRIIHNTTEKCPNTNVIDKYIQINLVIEDYFEDSK